MIAVLFYSRYKFLTKSDPIKGFMLKNEQSLKMTHKSKEPNSKQSSKKIVDQLIKLKQELKTIKSMKNIHFAQSSCRLDKYSAKKNVANSQKDKNNRSLFNKSLLNKQKSNLRIDQVINEKQQIQTERKILGNQLDMSLCKSIIKSHSNSKQKIKDKHTSKDKSKSISQPKDAKSHSKSAQSKTKKRQKPNQSHKVKSKKEINRISSFDNIFAHTERPINQEHEKYTKKDSEQKDIDDQKQFTKTKQKVKNKLKIKSEQDYNQNDVSFNIQGRFRQNHNKQSDLRQESKNYAMVCLNQKELSYRLRTIRNYDLQFNQINFSVGRFDQNQPSQIRDSCNKKSVLVNQKGSQTRFNRQLMLKSELVLNSLKKSLLRYPNFALIWGQSANQIKPLPFTGLYLAQIHDKSLQKMQQRYTQYLQQVQCAINQLVNFFNQYINSKDMQLIDRQQQFSKISSSKQKQNNCDLINSEIEKQKIHKKKIKFLNKQIIRLEQQLRGKQQDFVELEFKYILKCQMEHNSHKFTTEPLIFLQNSCKINSQRQISTHIQILQQENAQLYERISLISRQNQQKDHRIFQIQTKMKLLSKQLNQKASLFQLAKEDLHLKNLQIQSLRESVRSVEKQKEKTQFKTLNYRRQLEVLNQQITKSHQDSKQRQRQNQTQRSEKQNIIKGLQKTLLQIKLQQTVIQRQIIEQRKDKQRLIKNQIILNQRIQEITRELFIVKREKTVLEDQLKDLTKVKQILKQSESQKKTFQKLNANLQKTTELLRQQKAHMADIINGLKQKMMAAEFQNNQLRESISVLEQQLQKQINQVQRLQESIQRYKDRCVRAQIQLKQQKYIEENSSKRQADKHQSNLDQIKSIIKSHQYKLNLEPSDQPKL